MENEQCLCLRADCILHFPFSIHPIESLFVRNVDL